MFQAEPVHDWRDLLGTMTSLRKHQSMPVLLWHGPRGSAGTGGARLGDASEVNSSKLMVIMGLKVHCKVAAWSM